MKTLFLISSIFILQNCTSQAPQDYEDELIKLKSNHQKMLDKGLNMMKTEQQFMMDTDSIVNHLFTIIVSDKNRNTKKIREEQEAYKNEKQYLKDSLIDKINQKYSEFGLASNDEKMIFYAEIAALNYRRAIALSKLLQKYN